MMDRKRREFRFVQNNRRTLRLSKTVSLRADATRNRQTLIEIARGLFAQGDVPVTMEEIAKQAKVGVGTLYRHFPAREELVEAVYRTELDALLEDVERPLKRRSALAALRLWMDRYAQFVAGKHAMYDTLRLALTKPSTRSETRARIGAALGRFLDAGAADGTIRTDIQPDDLAVNLAAIVLGVRLSTDKKQLGRLLDLLIDGLRPH